MPGRMTINALDLRAMLDIANSAGPADELPFPGPVMKGLFDLIGCDTVNLTQFDARARIVVLDHELGDSYVELADDTAEWDRLFFKYYWGSPCSYPDVSGDLTTVTKLSDFCSVREWRRTRLYNAFVKPRGGEDHELMLCLPSRPGRVVRILFWRRGGSDFSERDRGLLTLLRPHLHRIYRAQGKFGDALTPRQRELLGLVAAGHTNGQIARRLSISEATVRKHLEHIFERLEVSSRTAAVAKAFGIDQ